jgi:hypothetical protein
MRKAGPASPANRVRSSKAISRSYLVHAHGPIAWIVPESEAANRLCLAQVRSFDNLGPRLFRVKPTPARFVDNLELGQLAALSYGCDLAFPTDGATHLQTVNRAPARALSGGYIQQARLLQYDKKVRIQGSSALSITKFGKSELHGNGSAPTLLTKEDLVRCE